MIIGTSDQCIVGQRYERHIIGPGIVTPFVVLRECTYDEWKHQNKDGPTWDYTEWEPHLKFFYEVSFD